MGSRGPWLLDDRDASSAEGHGERDDVTASTASRGPSGKLNRGVKEIQALIISEAALAPDRRQLQPPPRSNAPVIGHGKNAARWIADVKAKVAKAAESQTSQSRPRAFSF